MEFTIENEIAVVRPEENLVGDKNPLLRRALLDALDENCDVMIDLSKVEIIDSCGISVMIAAYNSLKAKDLPLIVTGCSDDITTLFKMMRLDKHLTIR